MNYLAHSFLAGKDEGLLIGNFIADHLRGNNFAHLPENIRAGIQMHRNIDAFTDAHPDFRESKRVFKGELSRYSGILADIYFDHLLAADFSSFSERSLDDHCHHVFSTYREHSSYLPQSSRNFLSYAISNDVYRSYARKEGIERVLYHLSHRIGHGVRLDHSVNDFSSNQDKLKGHFRSFMNDLIPKFTHPSSTHHGIHPKSHQ